jgi:hypothetical protein
MNPNSRHSSIGTLTVISQLTRETESRHRNGNPYGHDQTNNCHIILVALSIASERLVDIIKGLVPRLNQQRRKPAEEGVGKLRFR